MSFRRHMEIYRIDGVSECWERQAELSLPAHRIDEFPVGYSWRVALQQSPLPLHQPRLILLRRSVEGKNNQSPRLEGLNSVSHSRGALHSGLLPWQLRPSKQRNPTKKRQLVTLLS